MGIAGLEGSESAARSSQHSNAGTVRYIPQDRLNACGDACIKMVQDYHNVRSNELEANNRPMYQGLSLQQVVEKLYNSDLDVEIHNPTKAQTWTAEELSQQIDDNGPMIATRKLYGVIPHAVVLTKVSGNDVIFHDPWPQYLGGGPNKKMTTSDLQRNLLYPLLVSAKKTGSVAIAELQ